ncbi:MAG: TolC family protein, partial [Bacteroidetes bacterium]|nr:TolC family protein [Bacteroidota bacterium]
FSLQQALDYAKKNSVQVRNALLDIQIQQQTNRDITSAALPSITGNGSFTDYLKIPTTLIPAQFFGGPAGTFEAVQFGTKYNASGTLNLQQTLFDGQVFVGLQARSTSIALSQKAAEITEENIRANVYKIYYQLVVSKVQLQLLDANISRLTQLQHDTKAMFENGFAEKLSVDRLDVQMANLQTEKQTALNNIATGYLGLKVLIGMPARDSLLLTDTLNDQDVKQGALDLASFNYKDRRDFQLNELQVKLYEYNIKRYKLSYIPVLGLNAAYQKNAQRTDFDFFGKGDWYTTSYVGLSLTIPIFDGFSKDANIKKAKLQVRQYQNQLEALKISIDRDIETARLNYNMAISTMDVQRKNMDLAETVYNQTKKKYEVGTGSNADITTAETDLKQAQTNYINAVYTAIIAKVDYLKATGKL